MMFVTYLSVSSSADVFAKGAISSVNVTMQGTGRVTVAGVQKEVTAQLDGISSLFVDAASGNSSRGGCRINVWQPMI
jgi:hypothetical protein